MLNAPDHVVTSDDEFALEREAIAGFAIVGMACRFPGAKDISEFWRNLRDGVESVTFFSEQEQLESGVNPAFLKKPGFVNAGAVLEDAEYFDAAFFGFNPREAEVMDPQHRVFLETAWQALEHAGYDSEQYTGRIGVYCGVSMNTYLLFNLVSNSKLIESVGDLQVMIASDKDYLPTRVSHSLNLTGPSLAVQTACSSSLVAVHLACQSLMAGEADMALAGGASVVFPQKAGYLYQEGGVLSPDGHCRAFDARGQGTVEGSGAGVVVLKRLADAIADGDTILAVVRGSAVNNDGSSRAGFAAPSVVGQTAVIEEALALSGVDVETITYMEAHGGGTPLGDSIEVAAMTRAFRSSTEKNRFCAIGSVKTNIGHLSAAGGIASLIKCVLALQHRVIPASLHFEQPNPEIDFENSPFYVNTQLSEWRADGVARRAGVNSFGIGGTNVHLVVEEAPPVEKSGDSRPWQLLLLSAKTTSALETATSNLVEHLKKTSGQFEFPDVIYTLQVGRRLFSHRRMLVCRDVEEALSVLEKRDFARMRDSVEGATDRPVAFMFPGSWDDFASMGGELYRVEPAFKEHLDLCCDLLEPFLGFDLRKILNTGDQKLNRPSYARCALFVTEYALAKLWIEWGVIPQAMIGSGAGEYVAACLAGAISLEDALRLLAKDESLATFEEISFSPPQIPYISSVTGKWITEAEVTDPDHWNKALRQPDLSAQVLQELWRDEDFILLEVGSGRMISAALQSDRLLEQRTTFSSLKRTEDRQQDLAFLVNTLGSLWLAGARVKWDGFYRHERRKRVPLPAYPFERRRCWIAPQKRPQVASEAPRSLEKKSDVADWFYFRVWKHSAPVPVRSAGESFATKARWLVFNDRAGLGDRLIERLRLEGQFVMTVEAGESFARDGDLGFSIHPGRAEDYKRLLEELRAVDQLPEQIVHLWNVSRNDVGDFRSVPASQFETLSFYSLLYLAKAVADQNGEQSSQLWIISNGVQAVSGDESLCPQKAMLLGPCKVIAKENPNITCRSIDLTLAQNGSLQEQRIVDQLIAEFSTGLQDSVVAYRGSHRLIEGFVKITLANQGSSSPALRRGGVYLVTGALSRAGFELATYLATAGEAKIVLLDIASFPGREQWDNWLATHDSNDRTSRRISKLLLLENEGTEFLIVRADVTDALQMQEVIAQVVTRFGALSGVVHAVSATSEALIQVDAASKARSVLAPKIEGTLVLDRLLKDAQLDFFIACSSLASILGQRGQVSPCAADAFLDAYAHFRSYECGTPTIFINWDRWEDDGVATEEGMSSEEGADAFNRILNNQLPHVVVSMRDLNVHIERSKSSEAAALSSELKLTAFSRRARPRPELEAPYVAAKNQVEEILSRVWQHVFGLERIGIHDNFFQLGGDSILSIQIAAQASKAGLRLRAKHLFEYPTIAALAEAAAQYYDAMAAAGDSAPASGYTSSDASDFNWSQEDLDEISRAIESKLETGESSYAVR